MNQIRTVILLPAMRVGVHKGALALSHGNWWIPPARTRCRVIGTAQRICRLIRGLWLQENVNMALQGRRVYYLPQR